MKRVVTVVLALFICGAPARGDQFPDQPKPSRTTKAWIAMAVASETAAILDTNSTLDVKAKYPSVFRESDPLARAFVKLPAPAYYGTSIAIIGALDFASWKMARSRHGWQRKLWWLPMAAQTGVSADSAVWNHGIVVERGARK
jgi:hypothetical protein